jgi:HPt (histidine-containing phosphotransfer) domain-containing protein
MAKIDLSYLESIAAGDKDFIKEILGMFTKSTFPEIQVLENLSSNSEWDKLAAVAHRIKAPVQILGQIETYNLIVTLEVNAKQKANLEQIPELIATIKTQIYEINKEVEKMASSL